MNDVGVNIAGITFDNLAILREFDNICNGIKDEEFLETVPKGKLRRVKWMPIFKRLKQGIHDEMVQEFTDMWKDEDMSRKIEILEKQKEKFADENISEPVWRPQLADVKAQMRAHYIANLQKQKKLLESLAKEYEVRVARHKKILTAKRIYLKALQLDILKYQKKNEEMIFKMNEKLENHSNLTKVIYPAIFNEKMIWTEVHNSNEHL